MKIKKIEKVESDEKNVCLKINVDVHCTCCYAVPQVA